MAATNELQLLAEAISTNGEAESNGVKYIYMDDSTVYRFENNRMKKVSTTLLKKARTLIGSSQDQEPKKPKKSRIKQPKKPTPEQEEEDEPEPEPEQPEQPEQPEPKPRSNSKAKKPKTANPTLGTGVSIDLNEYYNNKNKMEYMMKEMDRLNNKVTKLKQYKTIVTRITGGEYDQSFNDTAPPPYAQQPLTTRRVRDDLFS